MLNPKYYDISLITVSVSLGLDMGRKGGLIKSRKTILISK